MSKTHPVKLHHHLLKTWSPPPGLGRLAAVNHTAMGVRFIIAALVFFLVGGILAMLMRAQLATSHNGFLDSELYSQIFTMHGTLMMFLFAIPMLEGFGFYLLPKMLGARDMAFPRLGAYAWYCYLFGGTIILVGMALGLAPNSGWFMYTPLSGSQYTPGINSDIWLIGITFAEISALCGATELIATILAMRAPGMSLGRMPIFAWYMLVTAGMILVGFPPLILGSILLELERAFNLPFFTVELGGDNLLWQHLFWLFGHPEVYIIFLPAAGLVSTMIPTFAGRPLVGYTWVVNSVIVMGFLSFGLWVHHMFTVGIPQLSLAFFSAASMLVAVPTAIQFFAWLATLWSGRVRLHLPMLYLGGFLVIFVLGGLTGVMVALVPFNVQVHDTHFVVAHFHYVLVGGMVFPIMAATYYWMPLIWGRMPSAGLGTAAFWLVFTGFNLTFFPMHLTGLLGMPRRVHTYSPEAGWDVLNLISSVGGFVQAIGFAVFVLDVLLHVRVGKIAPRNPWGAGTLEWALPKPPPPYNVASIPTVHGREPLWDAPQLPTEMAAGKHWLGKLPQTDRHTMGVDMMTGEPRCVVILPKPSWLPLSSGIVTAGFFLGLLFKTYMLSLGFAAVSVALFLGWAWTRSPREPETMLEARPGVLLPAHTACSGAPGWWGVVCAVVADATILASLIFGGWFLRLHAPNWPPQHWMQLPAWAWGGALVTMLLLAWSGHRSARHTRLGQTADTQRWLTLNAVTSAACMALCIILISWLPTPGNHAYYATMLVMLCYQALHLAITLIMALYVLYRSLAHDGRAPLTLDTAILSVWSRYTAFVVIILMGTMLLIKGTT